MPAFCNESALLYDPTSSEELADHIVACFTNPKLRNQLATAGKKQLRHIDIDWTTALKKRHSLFQDIISKSKQKQIICTNEALGH